ncbi:MAG TPA: 2TM domain-containing protein [Dehalococcoidales bacterium]|nr:2TM domain-containing protein [Dehalococcoidales bacterium]
MNFKMTEEQIYEEAKKRVEEKRGFYGHLAAYIIVNAILILIWAYASGRGFPWFLFPLGGWGIGLIFHFLGVFVFPGMSSSEAIAKEAEKIRKRQG